MKQNLYLFSDTLLKRNQNTLLCEKLIREHREEEENDDYEDSEIQQEEFLCDETAIIPTGDKKYIPVENIESIFTFGSTRFNTRFLYFLSQNHIPVHIFSFNGAYSGSFLPSERNFSGTTLLLQAAHYGNKQLRLFIAKQFTIAAAKNALANLKYHNNRKGGLNSDIDYIEGIISYIDSAVDTNELLGYEGIIKKTYYSAWRNIFSYPVEFTHRVKNPPNNLINALISYGNAIVYSTCLNQIYQTRLYPEIGYIHECGEGKLPLSYDLAEIFKPILTDRTIFKVINKNMISEKDCWKKNGRCLLKQDAKRIFVQELENKMLTKITIDDNRSFSYKRLIKEECYKLIKHLNGEEKYEALITRW